LLFLHLVYIFSFSLYSEFILLLVALRLVYLDITFVRAAAAAAAAGSSPESSQASA